MMAVVHSKLKLGYCGSSTEIGYQIYYFLTTKKYVHEF